MRIRRIDANLREDQIRLLEERSKKTGKSISFYLRMAIDLFFEMKPEIQEMELPKWMKDCLLMIDLIKEKHSNKMKEIELFWDTLLFPIFREWKRAYDIARICSFHFTKFGYENYLEIEKEGRTPFCLKFIFQKEIFQKDIVKMKESLLEMFLKKELRG